MQQGYNYKIIFDRLKDLYEDRKRKRSDNEENSSDTNLITTVGDRKVTWSELQVGHLIRVEKDNFFPADVLIINSSE